MRMLTEAKEERAETKRLIETRVGGLEEKVDAVVVSVKELASKTEKHDGTLTSLQEKMSTMENELQDLRNKEMEGPRYSEIVRESGSKAVPVGSVPERAVPVPGVEAVAGGRHRSPEKVEKVKNLFSEANSTLTFSPIAEEDWRQLVTRLVEEENMDQNEAEKEARYRMVEEYLAQEMLIKEEHIHDVMSQVKTIRPKSRTDWNALVVHFKEEDIADWILRGKGKMRRGVEGVNKPVVENWVPGGLYKRYNALRSVAYRIRQRDGLKTRINFGTSDFSLVTKRDRRDQWSSPVDLEMENLPGFQLSEVTAELAREQRSPTMAPGRARYGGTAPRQGKRLRVASPGLSPSGKEARVEEMRTSEGEDISSDIERNVTERRSRQKAGE